MLTGKTIGQLTYLETPTSDTLIPVELSGSTYHIDFSAITAGGLIEVTYSELVDKITGETLTRGTHYIITNFQTCYDQPDFNSFGNEIIGNNYKEANVEPIIVFAISANTISSTAYQPTYPNDRIQYDWTFSATERTQGVAYGRISERIDKFNNRTDYDHRTILFKRYMYFEIDINYPQNGTVNVIPTSSTEMTVTGTGTNFTSLSVGNYVGFQNDNFRPYEVVSISGNTEMYITGLTNTNLNNVQWYIGNSTSFNSYLQNNITTAYTEYYTFDYNDFNANNYIGNYANSYVFDENSFILANNVFQGSTYRNNTFGDMCYNNSFDDDCWNNTIGNYFYNNITDDDFDGNLIGNWFSNNRITTNFQYNRIGENFENNYIVQNSFYRNNIMNYFDNNVISGGDFQNNEIGNQFADNEIYDDFYNNDIGNGYNNNDTYRSFYRNLIGNGYNGNSIYSYFYENEIGQIFNNNTISTLADSGVYNFSGNRIGSDFENNTIYNNFDNNKISNQFKGNMMLNSFENNNIDSFISGNQFSGATDSNNIGNYTFDNNFLGVVSDNTWGSSFHSNTIGNDLINNNIGKSFNINNIGSGFQNNQIGDYFNYNDIGDNFGFGYANPQGNKIGSNFYGNQVGEYFYNNSIPDNFHSNEVGNYFQWNIINTNISDTVFTFNYGNLTGFSYTATGTGATDNTYSNIQILEGNTQSMGFGATFNVEVSGGNVVGVSGNTEGRLYVNNDVLTILGTQIGGVTGVIDGFSSDAIGKSGTTGSYTNLIASGTGGGENATFDINVTDGLVDTIALNNGGGGYSVNNILTIVGSNFGGVDGVDDITITISDTYSDDVVITVTGVTSGSLFYDHYTKQIFERRGGDKRVSFYDEEDILNVDSIYTISGYIPVYSQSLTFPISYTSFNFWCDGGYINNGGITNQTVNNAQELVDLFNNNFRQYGYFFDNNDGTIGLYINPSLIQQFCPNGTYTINVFND